MEAALATLLSTPKISSTVALFIKYFIFMPINIWYTQKSIKGVARFLTNPF